AIRISYSNPLLIPMLEELVKGCETKKFIKVETD
ncbi:unnamed protein product, partial [marine sediment metagenome]